MRGGNTDSALVVADELISAPPIVSRVWSVIAMHHRFWEPARAKLRPGSLVVVNHPVFAAEVDRASHRVFEVAASAIAGELGHPMSASMVLVAAFARITGLVGLDSLVAGMRDSVPSYRRQHVEANEKALGAGFASASPGLAPAWPASQAAPASDARSQPEASGVRVSA
jgi:Pyruvate/2-oxoacid:ferredoxin oxidoreductase gamma subunit